MQNRIREENNEFKPKIKLKNIVELISNKIMIF